MRIQILFFMMSALGVASHAGAGPTGSGGDEAWLVERSMLGQAETLARRYSGQGSMWRHPFGTTRPREAVALSSVWFTAYPASTITREGQSVLGFLGDPQLWEMFGRIGITGMHTGPMKRSGGLEGREYTPTIDGMFDRIGFEIDPAFGTDDEYIAMTRTASKAGAIVIGDVIPGHTGCGPDFQLALRGHPDFLGLYHMVEIEAKDWGLLPEVPAGRQTVNLPRPTVDRLETEGYIVGALVRTIFHEPGVKDTDWSASGVVEGFDGKSRRWVYLHYFKEGQPTLNWLDPSFAAQRLVIGDALHSLGHLGEKMLRLDANGFLGVEIGPGAAPAWSEGHPLSLTSNQLIGGMVRKLGGFSFQELNLTLEDIARSTGGADLSYDFVTRPAYHHALVTGDASFLRLMIQLAEKSGIAPVGLIHALQNHDELTLELVHFWEAHKADVFPFRDAMVPGGGLRDTIRQELLGALVGARAPYNLPASNGVSSTTVTVIAAALGIADVWKMSPEDVRRVQEAHLLLVLYNAMQPGVFAFSGWDLVGATTLPADSVKELLADGDTRWINRGAYDLLEASPDRVKSSSGLPRATALYGSLPAQLADPSSFVSRLATILDIRKRYRIAESRALPLPAVQHRSLMVMAHELPGGGFEITALNFGREAITEEVRLPGISGDRVRDLLAPDSRAPRRTAEGLSLELPPLTGKVLLVDQAGK